ncbi:hypothetical protein NGA_0711700 [Nannochloropsis gaditana CCMP526]|uniref:uncharacterized protein n=1 Tax=Nannochloropsis gaditana (strain CCMP526) TaxID=1093141 RepID=UPI00029F755E|nr:hypothetical protein NGA_0711700 [Nannochloropsis gaditana CCMP526]EKU23359.1 hypothetical protein NGA_0711700 [Nannochloropsis gaditana CCMP526]|eukprot:XP_005852473.1 hypothetical protein NGA_0711700 [Nannochloropsis gaditana CCMP526]
MRTMRILVVKVNLAGLTLSENVQLWGLTLRTSVVSGSYAYFGTRESPAVVLKVDLADFSLADILELGEYGGEQLSTSVLSRDYAYFGTETDPGLVLVVNLVDFSHVDSLDLSPYGGEFLSTSIVSMNYAYFGLEGFPNTFA